MACWHDIYSSGFLRPSKVHALPLGAQCEIRRKKECCAVGCALAVLVASLSSTVSADQRSSSAFDGFPTVKNPPHPKHPSVEASKQAASRY